MYALDPALTLLLSHSTPSLQPTHPSTHSRNTLDPSDRGMQRDYLLSESYRSHHRRCCHQPFRDLQVQESTEILRTTALTLDVFPQFLLLLFLH